MKRRNRDSIEKIKAFTEEGFGPAPRREERLVVKLLSSGLEEKTKPKTYLRTTTQIPTVDLERGGYYPTRSSTGTPVTHASLVEERIMLKINNLCARSFQKGPVARQSVHQKKESEAEKKPLQISFERG